MTAELIVLSAGPQFSLQDMGRSGTLSVGLSRGGAADRLALIEAAALLDQPHDLASLEMAGIGGTFEPTARCRICLTGAPMRAAISGKPVMWNAVHAMDAGEILSIGAAEAGVYGYLSVGGGFATPKIMGSRAAHLVARVGERTVSGDRLPIGPDANIDAASKKLSVDGRMNGGRIRVVPGAQTSMFSDAQRQRFEATDFVRDQRGNRQGVRLDFEGEPFGAEGGRTVLSEVIVPGDIQMTGEGTPYVLLPECQTTGGYPRIGSVVPNDLPRVAQAAPGTPLRFKFMAREEAVKAHKTEGQILGAIRGRVEDLVRNPAEIADLLAYQLISGVTSGQDAN